MFLYLHLGWQRPRTSILFAKMFLILRWLVLNLGVPLTCFVHIATSITLTWAPCIQLDFNRMEILNYKLNRDFVFTFIFNHSDKQITLMNGFASTHSRIMVWFNTRKTKFTLCWALLFHSMFATTILARWSFHAFWIFRLGFCFYRISL